MAPAYQFVVTLTDNSTVTGTQIELINNNRKRGPSLMVMGLKRTLVLLTRVASVTWQLK